MLICVRLNEMRSELIGFLHGAGIDDNVVFLAFIYLMQQINTDKSVNLN